MVESTNRVTKHAYADEVTTLELVMRKEHYIPKYQRNYDWETSHCSELLEDLKKFTDNPRKDINSKYMFGQMVAYNSDSNKLYILDGQQRLTTAALLVAAVRNILRRVEIHNPGCEKLQEEKFKMKKELAIEFALVKISTEEFATFEENFQLDKEVSNNFDFGLSVNSEERLLFWNFKLENSSDEKLFLKGVFLFAFMTSPESWEKIKKKNRKETKK